MPEQSYVIPKYQYGEQYQIKILALLVRIPNFIHKFGEVIRPEYFEYEIMAQLARLILQFYKQYAVQPSIDHFNAMLMDYCNKYNVHDRTREHLIEMTSIIFTMDMSDADAVRDTAIEFAQRQSLKKAVLDIVDILDRANGYQQAADIVQKALMVGTGIGQLGVEVFSTMHQLPGLIAQDGPYSIARKIRTCFPSLDASRYGGIGPGECIVIAGSSGQGKSIIKNNLAYMASLQAEGQGWVAHATLELSELDNQLRYAARILGCAQEDIVRNTPLFQQKIREITIHRRIYVKWFAPMMTTPGALRSWISALSAELGTGPCALVVDYPDKMSPSSGRVDNLYIDNGRIYAELINLLHDYQMPGYFSSQLDRANQYQGTSRASNISNSIAKLYDADIVGTINQTEEDKRNGVARIFWDKNRRGRDMFHTNFRIDYSRCMVYEETDTNSVAQETAASAFAASAL